MLANADVDVAEFASELNGLGLMHAFLVPTGTGLEKSIMDATDTVRSVLSECGYHNFDDQAQGEEAKVVRSVELWVGDSPIETKLSLYRPQTKNGDPRIWPSRLGQHVQPGNLLALIPLNTDELVILNGSSQDLRSSLQDPDSALRSQLNQASQKANERFEDLLGRLRSVASKGFLPSRTPGADAGVGNTLEHALGIVSNSSKVPDYRGIEIKAGRVSRRHKNRSNLFSQVPAWSESLRGSSADLLEAHGRDKDGRRKLYHTLSVKATNSYGLRLRIHPLDAQEIDEMELQQVHETDGTGPEVDVLWRMKKLIGRLREKHPETVWVNAQPKMINGLEHFRYESLVYTRQPDPEIFVAMIRGGHITVDYTISTKPDGGVKDKGYLFKIAPKVRSSLFSHSREISLL